MAKPKKSLYEHVYPHDWFFDHEALPHHNDRGSCALCLAKIRPVRATKTTRRARVEE